MIKKRVLVASRLRRPPSEGFSWVDRRFLTQLLSLPPARVERGGLHALRELTRSLDQEERNR